MAELETLSVESRDKLGSRNNRRLRGAGLVPAVLYGHGQENLNLQIPAKTLEMVIRRGHRTVVLAGAADEPAMIQQLHWDVFGIDVLHVDLLRVNRGELVEVTVSVELHGIAPGAAKGMVVHHLHEVSILAPADSLPEKLEIDINDLKIGQSLHARDIPLPVGAKLLTNPDETVVACEAKGAEPEEKPAATSAPAE